MFGLFKKYHTKTITVSEVTEPDIFDEKTFYFHFINDLKQAEEEVIIESPYITLRRANELLPIFRKLLRNDVKIYVITRNPNEHEIGMDVQAEKIIQEFEALGVRTLINKGNTHRKFAIIDRKILWNGSLNILSQNFSREMMLRTESGRVAMKIFNFLRLDKYL